MLVNPWISAGPSADLIRLQNLLHLSITGSQIQRSPTKTIVDIHIYTVYQKPPLAGFAFFTARWSGVSDASSRLTSDFVERS
jgi:hypothetical protein